MLIGKRVASCCSTSWFLRRSAVQWKKSLMLYSNAAINNNRGGLLRRPDASGLGRIPRLPFPALSLMSQNRAKHDGAKQFDHPVNFTSSSDYDDRAFRDTFNETLLNENDIFKYPQNRNRFGVLKALLIIIAGVYFGAWLAMIGAYVLEELEIFVDDDDDDD